MSSLFKLSNLSFFNLLYAFIKIYDLLHHWILSITSRCLYKEPTGIAFMVLGKRSASYISANVSIKNPRDDTKSPHDFSQNTSSLLRMIVDSGCSRHLSNLKKEFFNNYQYRRSIFGTASASALITAPDIGDIGPLKGVRHCPDLSKNLLSASSMR